MSSGRNETALDGVKGGGDGTTENINSLHPTYGFSGKQPPLASIRNQLAKWIATPDQVFSRDLSLQLDRLTQYEEGSSQQLEILGQAARMCRRSADLHEDLAEQQTDWLKAAAHRDIARDCQGLLFTLQNEITRIYCLQAKARAA